MDLQRAWWLYRVWQRAAIRNNPEYIRKFWEGVTP